MNVIAHGIDLVALERFARLLDERGDRFVERCFTEAEQRYAAGRGARRVEALAARFAAKEAVLKALGTGLEPGMAWTDIEVSREGDGPPEVRLRGRVRERAAEKGVRAWLLSVSHDGDYAMASVLALGDS